MSAYEDPMWVASMLGLCVQREAEAVPVVRQGSLWKSRATRRRCRVLWVTEDIVCLTYCDGVGVKQHKVDDLRRLYFEV